MKKCTYIYDTTSTRHCHVYPNCEGCNYYRELTIMGGIHEKIMQEKLIQKEQ